LTLAVYQITATFPREELYGLTSPLRRCCSSIPANLAGGCGRNGDAEFARFARSLWDQPASWNITCCCQDLKLIKPQDHAELSQRATELKRMLAALLPKLKADR